MSRAVPVVMEKSPGGGHGWMLSVGLVRDFKFCAPLDAMGWVSRMLGQLGATEGERFQVCQLLASELERKRRAEVTAEIAAPIERIRELAGRRGAWAR